MALTPEQLQEIKNQVTKMVHQGRSDADIQAWKANYLKSAKTVPQVDQTGTPVGGGDSVSGTTSSELPKEEKKQFKDQTMGEFASDWLDRRLGWDEDEEDYLTGTIGSIVNSIPWIGDVIDDGARAIGAGRAQARIVDDALKLFAQGEDVDPEVLENYLARAKELENQTMSSEMKAFNEIYEQSGAGVWGFLKAIAIEPQAAVETIASSLVAMINPSSALGAGLGAGAGAAIGSAAPIVGTGIGAIGGATGGASAVLDTAMSFNEFLQEELHNRGLEFDEKGVSELFKDQDAINRIRGRAAGRGATIGIIDALTAGVAGKVGKGIAKTAGKAAYGTAAAFATEAAGGGVGESLARVVAGQEQDAREIGLEIFGEFGQAVPVVKQIKKEIKEAAPEKINGQPVTPGETKSYVESGDPSVTFSNVETKDNDTRVAYEQQRYGIDLKENEKLTTKEEKAERAAIVKKIDALAPAWKKADADTRKVIEQDAAEHKAQLQDIAAKQGERISYLNPEQQAQFAALGNKIDKVEGEIQKLESVDSPAALIEKKKSELEEIKAEQVELFNQSETLLNEEQAKKEQAKADRQAKKEAEQEEATTEEEAEEVIPDPIAEQTEEVKQEILKEDIDNGQSDADEFVNYLEQNSARTSDWSDYKTDPQTSEEGFSPLGQFSKDLKEGDFTKIHKTILDSPEVRDDFVRGLENLAIKNDWNLDINDLGTTEAGNPILEIKLQKPRQTPLSEAVKEQMESNQEGSQFEGTERERTPAQAAIDYAQSEDKNQGGAAYEGIPAVETEDGGVFYEGLEDTPKARKQSGIHATIRKMKNAGYFWNNPDSEYTVSDAGITINKPDGRKDTGVELSLAEEAEPSENFKVENDLEGVEGDSVQLNIGLNNNPYGYAELIKMLKNNKDLILGTTELKTGEYEGQAEPTLVVDAKYRGSAGSFREYVKKLTNRTTQEAIPYQLDQFGELIWNNNPASNRYVDPKDRYGFDPQYFKKPTKQAAKPEDPISIKGAKKLKYSEPGQYTEKSKTELRSGKKITKHEGSPVEDHGGLEYLTGSRRFSGDFQPSRTVEGPQATPHPPTEKKEKASKKTYTEAEKQEAREALKEAQEYIKFSSKEAKRLEDEINEAPDRVKESLKALNKLKKAQGPIPITEKTRGQLKKEFFANLDETRARGPVIEEAETAPLGEDVEVESTQVTRIKDRISAAEAEQKSILKDNEADNVNQLEAKEAVAYNRQGELIGKLKAKLSELGKSPESDPQASLLRERGIKKGDELTKSELDSYLESPKNDSAISRVYDKLIGYAEGLAKSKFYANDPELLGAARLATFEAVKSFDGKTVEQLKTHVYNTVRDSVNKAKREGQASEGVIKLPEKLKRFDDKILKALKAIGNYLDYSPTDEQIASEINLEGGTNITPENIREHRAKVAAYRVIQNESSIPSVTDSDGNVLSFSVDGLSSTLEKATSIDSVSNAIFSPEEIAEIDAEVKDIIGKVEPTTDAEGASQSQKTSIARRLTKLAENKTAEIAKLIREELKYLKVGKDKGGFEVLRKLSEILEKPGLKASKVDLWNDVFSPEARAKDPKAAGKMLDKIANVLAAEAEVRAMSNPDVELQLDESDPGFVSKTDLKGKGFGKSYKALNYKKEALPKAEEAIARDKDKLKAEKFMILRTGKNFNRKADYIRDLQAKFPDVRVLYSPNNSGELIVVGKSAGFGVTPQRLSEMTKYGDRLIDVDINDYGGGPKGLTEVLNMYKPFLGSGGRYAQVRGIESPEVFKAFRKYLKDNNYDLFKKVYDHQNRPSYLFMPNKEYSISSFKATQVANKGYLDAVTDALSKAWPGINIARDGYSIGKAIRGLGVKIGQVKGAYIVGENTVVLNPERASFDTPIHEFAHVWLKGLQRNNPELFNRGKELLKGSEFARKVYDNPTYRKYLENEPNRFWEEVMANAIGKRGAELFNNNKKAGAWDKWMNKIGKWVKKRLGISSSKNYNDLTLNDWLNAGVHGVFTGTPSSPVNERVELSMIENDPSLDSDISAAYLRGKKAQGSWYKKPLSWLIPPQADDYHGLVSKLKGIKGVKAVTDAFVENHHDHINRVTKARKRIADITKALGVPLSKKGVTELNGNKLTAAQAIQAHVNGFPNSFSKTDKAQAYIKAMTDLGVLKPSQRYDTASPAADLYSFLNNDLYVDSFKKFNEEKSRVFDEKTMEAITAEHGPKYAEALTEALRRMSSGKNSKGGGVDGSTSKWNDWALGSVGTIMFFNFRSAALQLMSVGNFGFEAKNPGKFMANFFNPKTFAKAKELYNSPYLAERRKRAGFDVNAAEMMDRLQESKSFGDFTKKVLNTGFMATSFVDSLAIAMGGAAFIQAQKDSGVSEAKAIEQWKESTEAAQQSARPDRVSQWQTEGVSKFVLAFANTPQQYFRLSQKAFRSIKEGKDVKRNIAKIGYYMAVQNMIFTAAQQASWALLGLEDDDEKVKDGLNSMTGTILRGMGLYGAVIDAGKNVIVEAIKQEGKARPDHVATALKATSISPPLNRKLQDLQAIGRAHNYDADDKVATTIAKGTSFATNLPADWAQKKYNAAVNLWNDQYTAWQKLLMLAGWSEWNFKDNDKAEKELDFDELEFDDIDFNEVDFEDIKF